MLFDLSEGEENNIIEKERGLAHLMLSKSNV